MTMNQGHAAKIVIRGEHWVVLCQDCSVGNPEAIERESFSMRGQAEVFAQNHTNAFG
jgi:hypothetical protein